MLECFITFLKYNIMMTGRASGRINKPLMVSTYCIISTKFCTQISCKISDVGHLLHTQNGMLCHKERYILLLECIITFLRYVTMIRGASDSIDKPLMVHNVSFLPTTNLNFMQYIRFWAPCQHRK